MTWIFTYIGITVAVFIFSLIGGLVFMLTNGHKDFESFLCGAWCFAQILAIVTCIAIVENGLI